MTVLFDLATGRLRLSRRDWECLLAWYADRPHDDEAVAELREVGVIHRDQVHPFVQFALDAVREPTITVSVDQRDHCGRRSTGAGWTVPGVSAFALETVDDLVEVVTVPSSMLPSTLARIVGLGPRVRPERVPVPMSAHAFDLLLDADPGVRQRVIAELDARLPGLHSGPWNDWSILIRWSTNQCRRLRVVDSREGPWRVDHDGDSVLMSPTDPTSLWRTILRLLPQDNEEPAAADGGASPPPRR